MLIFMAWLFLVFTVVAGGGTIWILLKAIRDVSRRD